MPRQRTLTSRERDYNAKESKRKYIEKKRREERERQLLAMRIGNSSDSDYDALPEDNFLPSSDSERDIQPPGVAPLATEPSTAADAQDLDLFHARHEAQERRQLPQHDPRHAEEEEAQEQRVHDQDDQHEAEEQRGNEQDIPGDVPENDEIPEFVPNDASGDDINESDDGGHGPVNGFPSRPINFAVPNEDMDPVEDLIAALAAAKFKCGISDTGFEAVLKVNSYEISEFLPNVFTNFISTLTGHFNTTGGIQRGRRGRNDPIDIQEWVEGDFPRRHTQSNVHSCNPGQFYRSAHVPRVQRRYNPGSLCQFAAGVHLHLDPSRSGNILAGVEEISLEGDIYIQ